MSKTNDGGPAFPETRKEKTGFTAYEETVYYEGMTLRDYFAAKAMNGIVGTKYVPKLIAEWSYQVADAMIEEREKNK